MSKKWTISSIFLLPTLRLNREKLKEFGFENAYIKDIEKEGEYENCLFLLFKPSDYDGFMDFVEREYDNKDSGILEDYDYAGGFVILVYKLDLYKRIYKF